MFGSVLARENVELRIGQKGALLMERFQILNKFQIGSSQVAFVYSICIAEDGLAWVSVHGSPIRLVDRNGKVRREIPVSPQAIYTTSTSDGEVLVAHGYASPLQKSVKRITKTGRVSVFASFSPCDGVFGIVSTKNGDVVCLVDQGGAKYYVTRLKTENCLKTWTVGFGQIHSYVKMLCLGPNGHACFHNNLKVFTVDEGHISTLCQLEKPQSEYGPLTCDKSGHIIIGDRKGIIDVYSTEGKRLKRYRISEKESVQSLATDEEDLLWIGTDSGSIYIAEYIRKQRL